MVVRTVARAVGRTVHLQYTDIRTHGTRIPPSRCQPNERSVWPYTLITGGKIHRHVHAGRFLPTMKRGERKNASHKLRPYRRKPIMNGSERADNSSHRRAACSACSITKPARMAATSRPSNRLTNWTTTMGYGWRSNPRSSMRIDTRNQI